MSNLSVEILAARLELAWTVPIANVPDTLDEVAVVTQKGIKMLSHYVSEARAKTGMNAGQLAQGTGMPKQDIKRLLNGVGRWPSAAHFSSILGLLATTGHSFASLENLIGIYRIVEAHRDAERAALEQRLPRDRLMDAVRGVLETPTTLDQWMEEHMTQTTPVAPSPAPVPTPAPLPAAPPEAPAPPANLPLTGSPFHAALWFARTAAGLTVDELAARVGVHNSSVHGWEANATTPIHMHYTKLCEVLPALKQARAPGSRDIPKPGRATGSVAGPASGQVAPAPLEGSLASLRGARQLIALLKTVNDSAEYPDFVRLLEKASSEGMTVAEVLELFAV